ncbi:aldo/keto reductase [Nonomuraea longicatena]
MRFALGTIPFGTAVNERDTFAILDRFAEAGGTVLDTANNYPFWIEGCTGDESEQAIGAWLAARGNRDRMVLSTKVGARPVDPADLSRYEGLSAPVIAKAVEGSLRRLRTDYIDVYWSHVEDRSVTLEETLGAFHELTADGRVREIGASNVPAWRLERARAVARANGWTPYTHVQSRHTYLRPRPNARLAESAHVLVTDDLLDYVADTPDLTLWPYNTLLAGAYTREDRPLPESYDHPGTARRLKVLREVAIEVGATPNQVVLAWLIADGHLPIVGVSSLAQLEEAVTGASLSLDGDQKKRMAEAW